MRNYSRGEVASGSVSIASLCLGIVAGFGALGQHVSEEARRSVYELANELERNGQAEIAAYIYPSSEAPEPLQGPPYGEIAVGSLALSAASGVSFMGLRRNRQEA